MNSMRCVTLILSLTVLFDLWPLPVAAQTKITAPPALAKSAIDEAKVIDLTYSFDETTIYWPTAKPFLWEKEAWGQGRAATGTRQPAMRRASTAARIWTARSISARERR